MIAALTGSGLAAAAGLNAYIPFLLVAVLARATDVVQLPADYAWVRSDWAIALGAVLLFTELVLDKIPVVDHVNDMVATLIRPTVGGLIFSATSSAQNLDNSAWMQHNPWVGAILGAVLAGITHTTKAAVRPAVNVTTAGVGAPVISTLEDIASLGLSIAAIFAPVLVLVFLVVLAWSVYRLVRWLGRRRRRRAEKAAARSATSSGPGGPAAAEPGATGVAAEPGATTPVAAEPGAATSVAADPGATTPLPAETGRTAPTLPIRTDRPH